MDPELRTLLVAGGGLVTRSGSRRAVPGWAIDNACRSGSLRRVLPDVYLDPDREGEPNLRCRAALAYVGDRGALSHTTALALWGCHEWAPGDPVHVTVPAAVRLRSFPGLVLHRVDGFEPEPPYAVRRQGRPVTRLERSLVDSWPLLPMDERRAVVIEAVNGRMTTVARLGEALAGAPRLAGRREFRVLLERLAIGCRSPLEIWGHERVFSGPGMPTFLRQERVRVAGRAFDLDVYAERERVDFELDGAAWHGDRRQREADVRRDALLATLGILVVRFTHRRLTHEPSEIRHEILAILAARNSRLS
ncbi:DUF559 domain-containing protein [Micromonospora sp. NBC_01796]|uniref:DUF559 domain-containing protein n=1 Tax=Micromonospora sp. NBC_01796 TaxID=2975987 RepID=UPI002DDA4E52|nr:DUF559 domain-containing protein [Micromonospora sp. NBC_01796]WSA89351.1 DUF559 domain-containing protein [Micromonospora sp. NBC_01796]